MQDVLERLRVSKTTTTPLHPQSGGMVEHCVKTIEGHLRKVVSTQQRDWDERLPIFLLAYQTSTHDTTDVTPVDMEFQRELRLSCDLMFGFPRSRKGQQQTMQPTLSSSCVTTITSPDSTLKCPGTG